MKKKRISFLFFAVSVIGHLLPFTCAADETIELTAFGQTLDQAITNGLEEAIRRVNGSWIETDREFRMQFESVVNNLRGSRSVGTEVVKEKHISRCKGLIKNYEVLGQTRESTEQWTLVMRIVVAVYDPKNPRPGERRTIAIIPFRNPHNSFIVDGAQVSSEDLNRRLAQGLVSHLVQSRKFTVLDREYMAERIGEQSLLKAGSCPLSELVKLGQQLGADHLVVGSLEKVVADSAQKTVKLTGYVYTERSANMAVAYRVLDVATGKINWANTTETFLSSEDFKSLSAGKAANFSDELLIERMANEMSSEILEAIYPVKVVKTTSSGQVILNQGGIRISEGKQYEIYALGEKLIDPDTNEFLGQEEEFIALIEVTRVTSKLSYASVLDGNIQSIKTGAVCRPKESNME